MSSDTKLVQFINCRIIRNHELYKDDLWIENGKIIDPEKLFYNEKRIADVQIDCKNGIIAPGLIDIQINGGFGVDFSYDTKTVREGLSKVAKGILAHGVTSFCPTLVTSPPNIYHEVLPKIQRRKGGKDGATILGVHVEGPFINKTKKGAHPGECIMEFEQGIDNVIDIYGSLNNIQIVTLAPEKDGSSSVIKEMTKRGIIVSVGHSSANLSDGEKAVQHGASLITHLFNAMLPFHHRDPGLVGLLTSDQIPEGMTVFYGIIADGVHTHPAALRIAYRAHPEGLILVTDAISGLGLPAGRHHIGQLEMEVRGSAAYIYGTETLCGSITPLIECVRKFRQSTDCSIVQAIEAASLKPAQCLNIENAKGTLDFGADADFILLDDDLNVLSTWIAGDCVYTHDTNAK